ncbi:phospho-sugar mutase [Lacrimispora amygdalina]|uniref:Phosphoglucomutase n=1 Tax=Lacrimispora amygdalina TaxID=253257 RepID=A0A3E2N4S9_9FIRM|nr:phospho-sugar mutase [Clostridium indicum]RFZ75986.1 phospho-sugar mutase [Clostridium indicum]
MDQRVYRKWCEWKEQNLSDEDLKVELYKIETMESEIYDRFYRELEFGTGGLRGIIGVGTNRMNIYTVAKATQGYCNYLKKKSGHPSVAIAYDSRIKSEKFAYIATEVFAANGIKAYIYSELMPTPSLSFAVRELNCSGGIVITASHNPSKYNGYKVYGSDGCQITTEAASSILKEIEALDIFNDIRYLDFYDGLAVGKISYIPESVMKNYLNSVSSQSLCDENINKEVSIVYTPLNGSGLKCVTSVLRQNGFTNISVVKEQENPDGEFPTCPYPNPEIKEALELGLRDAKERGSELLLATDPDCDRVGIAVRNDDDYVLLTGNEVGMLLLDYICKRRIALGKMPNNPILVKTIVTIDMANRIAEDYGVQVIDVLTGFKFIGEQIGFLEAKGEEDRFILGFEESYGYLTGGYVRDKDAVVGALMICEMFAYYKTKGVSLIDVLEELYKKYGYCLNTLHSYTFEGAEGFQKMQNIMQELRENPLNEIEGLEVIEIRDYLGGLNQLPKSDVLKYMLVKNSSIVIRPSGTEPKLKVYLSVSAKNRNDAEKTETAIVKKLEKLFYR